MKTVETFKKLSFYPIQDRKKIGVKVLKEIGCIVRPDTILKWFRELIAKKLDGSKNQTYPGRPKVSKEIEELVISMAKENLWGYRRTHGALSNLGHDIDATTVRNILLRNGLPTSPERKSNMDWADFIKSHKQVMAACNFFTQEVLTPVGLVTYYVLFFIKHATREVHIAGVTDSLNKEWTRQIARNVTMEECGFLNGCKYLVMDRDPLFHASFREIMKSRGIKPIRLPPKSPNLVAFPPSWLRRHSKHPVYQRICRTLGQVCQGRVLVSSYLLWCGEFEGRAS